MLLLTMDHIPGKQIEVLGLVDGSVVQSKDVGSDFVAGMRAFVGGEISEYTKMLSEARQLAVERMMDAAEAMYADAIINIRYSSCAIMEGAAEIIAYGTAVKYV